MESTTVHLPRDLVRRLDELACRMGVPRDRLIVQALESLLDRERGGWPEGFFSNDHLTPAELRDLRRAEPGWIAGVRAARRTRAVEDCHEDT